MEGFSFNGIHCNTLGCWYRPSPKQQGGEMEDYEISAVEPDHRDGGYYIGTRVKPRLFELECFFEEVSEAGQEKIYRWLRRDTRGQLVFDHKPYAHYDAVTNKAIVISLYDHTNDGGEKRYAGTFSASFACYEPFAQLASSCYDAEPDECTLARTGQLPAVLMPEIPTAETRSFLLYNPGTEVAHTILRIAGDVGDGMLIRNLTTSQRCRVIDLKTESLLEGAVLELDSAKGQTRTVLGDKAELAFPFHDEGYITLAPCTPFVRSLPISYAAGSNEITSNGGFQPHMVGQFVYLEDGWKSIRQVIDDNTAIVSAHMSDSGAADTPVVTMNEIEISGDNLALDRLEIDYVPRVR